MFLISNVYFVCGAHFYVLPQEKPGKVMKGGPFLHPKVVVLNQSLN